METQDCSVIRSIRTKLADCGSSYSSNICIYRVPPKLRGVNEAAYTPQVIGIGPFHHGKEHLADMERHKYIYLNKFLGRVDRRRLEDFVSYIQQSEGSIRKCYADALEDLSSDEFCEIILVDSIFILELFKSTEEGPQNFDFTRPQNQNFDFIVHGAWPNYQIKEDLMLLENQIPWFVLKQLYEAAFGTVHNNQPFHDLATNYFSDIVPLIESLPSDDGTKHFTDLVRQCLLIGSSTEEYAENSRIFRKSRTSIITRLFSFCNKHELSSSLSSSSRAPSQDENENSSRGLLYSATKLREAGVRFKVTTNPCMLNIKFENGKLEIPQLEFHDHTECIYRNVMALEQCHYPSKTAVCHYVKVLDDLINTAKDVELLVENKIVSNLLGEHQTAANVINKFCLHICLSGSYAYAELIKDLNAYYEVPCNNWKANLKHEYFSTPWRIASAIAAFILLALALTQTLFTILQYALPQK